MGEVSRDTGLPAHVLRYWESRFPQLRPVTRAGQRRHYRPEDVALVVRIDRLLNERGYTIRGVQKVLEEDPGADVPAASPVLDTVRQVRDTLAAALADD
nr:MerR family transcriptional regulator [Sphingomonas bacterium]